MGWAPCSNGLGPHRVLEHVTERNYEKLTKATQKCSAEIQQIKHARHAFNAKQSQSSIVSITLIQTSMTAVQAELMNNVGTACIQ